MIGDHDLAVSKLFGMLPAEEVPGKRTPADNHTVRHVFVIGPDKKVKLVLAYPMTGGRNFDAVLRVIDALQLNAKHHVPVWVLHALLLPAGAGVFRRPRLRTDAPLLRLGNGTPDHPVRD